MPEIKTKIEKLYPGISRTAGDDDYLITEAHTLADIVRLAVSFSSYEEIKCLVDLMGEDYV